MDLLYKLLAPGMTPGIVHIMDRLKEALLEAENEGSKIVADQVEVIGLTIASCLNRAGEFLHADLIRLDYEILEKGKKSFLNPKPYRLHVALLAEESQYADLEEFSLKLGVGDRLLGDELDQFVTPKHQDGRVQVRIYRTGVYMTVFPPLGDGRSADINQAQMRIAQAGIQRYDASLCERAVQQSKGEPIKLTDWSPKPECDSTVKVEMSPDEMKAVMRITPPRPGGLHLQLADVVNALRSYGVVIGFKEEDIQRALMEDRYMEDILAAQGQPPKHGADAYIDYKVSVKSDGVDFEEDSAGRVDFKQMNLIENVVVGQILAEKVPAQQGTYGRTLSNRIVEARDGKDIDLRQGRGTILSEDKMRLIAEINGQVVFSTGKIAVEPVHRVNGDVGPKTGNIMFLGSVSVSGNVLDNYEIKAAGNIDIGGAVQKARIEAEGDIVVKQGIHGREGAHIESTGGSLIAKFVQSAEVFVSQDVIVQEGILHSKVEAGGKIHCNGRRAQIVGGTIRAGKEVRARIIGSQAYTATDVVVGTDPRILAQFEELTEMLKTEEESLARNKKETSTLEARKKADPSSFTDEQDESLVAKQSYLAKLDEKISELREEIARVEAYMEELGSDGRVHAEKEIFPGVVVTIKDKSQNIADSYRAVTLSYENGYVKIGKLEKEESASRSWRDRR